MISPPATNSPFIPPLLPLLPQIVQLLGLAIPAHPLHRLPLRRRAAVGTLALQEALLEREAHHLLLLHALAEALIQRRRRERAQRAVHVALLLPPLPLERVRREQLALCCGALVREPRL